MPWWREEALRERDAALRALAEGHLVDLSPAAQSRRIHELSRRYAAASWRFDRGRAAMPVHYTGTVYEQLWRAFKAGAAMPICDRQLRTILAR